MMPYATPPAGGPSTVRVLKSEEKGSDVNLATTLLVDAFDDDFEQAVVAPVSDSNEFYVLALQVQSGDRQGSGRIDRLSP